MSLFKTLPFYLPPIFRRAYLVFSLGLVSLLWAEKPSSKGTIALLDLVDLSSNKTLPLLSEKLGSAVAGTNRWKMMSRDEAIKRLEEYNRYLFTPCNDPQCAFDLGGMLETNFVMYGTATRYEDIGIMSLKLMDLKTAKIIWAEVLTSRSDGASIEATFKEFAEALKTANFREGKKLEDALMAVLSFGDESIPAKILAERVFAHAYNNAYFELMSSTETAELMQVLEIDPTNIENSLQSVKGLGKKLGVKAILYSEYAKVGVNHKHSISLFDIKTKSVIVSMPALPNSKFKKVLRMENHFFKGLGPLLESRYVDGKK